MMTTMTVREAIYFSARLRLPAAVSLADKKDRVDKVIYIYICIYIFVISIYLSIYIYIYIYLSIYLDIYIYMLRD